MANLYEDLQKIYLHYKTRLFDRSDKKLPFCQINLCRKTSKSGFFVTERWINGEMIIIHEINLNPQILDLEAIKWHAILVFYMAQLWQYLFGTRAEEKGYCNMELVKNLEALGYIVQNAGGLGGKKSGRNISFEVSPVGLLYSAFLDCPIKEVEFQPLPEEEEKKKKKEKKTKYQCPSCNSNMWGKQWIMDICCECWELRIPQGISEEEYPRDYYKKVQVTKKVLALLRKLKNQLYLKVSAEYDVVKGGNTEGK